MSESSNRILLRSTLGSLAPPSRGGFGSVRSYLNAFQLICEIQRTRNPTTSAGRWGEMIIKTPIFHESRLF